jgi:hypothetical protein
MRRVALLLCSLGCYPGSELSLSPGEGILSAILLGRDDERVFAYASAAEEISVPFTAADDVVLETLLFRRSLAELGVPEGPVPIVADGRPPPTPISVLRTRITGGDFSGWEDVADSELSPEVKIPFFDANACGGCITADEHRDPLCKLDCDPQEPMPPAEVAPPQLPAFEVPPACPLDQVAYVGETCHAIGPPCAADGWPPGEFDAFVRPGSNGVGTRDSPLGSVPEAIGAGAIRIALSTGTHEFDGHLSVPVELLGACADETIVVSVLRTTANLMVHDVTVMGGIETSDRLDVRRVHVHGGPMLAETASITGSDLALHDSHFVIADSAMTLERVFVASNLASLTCWGSDITIDDAVFGDSTGPTLSVTSSCTLALSRAVLTPALLGARVERSAALELSDAFITSIEGGIRVDDGGRADIARTMMIGDDGLIARGDVEVQDIKVVSTDDNSGSVAHVVGTLRGARVILEGRSRGIHSAGVTDLQDVAITSDSVGAQTDLAGRLILQRASLSARIVCLEAHHEVSGTNLRLNDCETGISSTETLTISRAIAGADVEHGAQIFSGTADLSDVRFSTMSSGVDAASGTVVVRRFAITDSILGASLVEGSLTLEDGRLERLDTGLSLPDGVRPEDILRDVIVRDVARVTRR